MRSLYQSIRIHYSTLGNVLTHVYMTKEAWHVFICLYVFLPWASHVIAFSGIDDVNGINDVSTLNFAKITQAFIATKTNHVHASPVQTITTSVPADGRKNIYEVASCR